MPAVIVITILIIMCSRKKPKQRARKAAPKYLPVSAPVVYDPIKAQKEVDRQRREKERQEDRKRRERERAKKQAEQEAKKQEAREAAQDEINWLHSYIDRLSALYDQIEKELENPSLTEYKRIQLQKQLLQTEEKIHRNKLKLDKAYFTANN